MPPVLPLSEADRKDLVATIRDLGDAALDQVAPLGRRHLGRVTARATIRDAYRKALAALGEKEAGHAHGA